MNLNSQSEVLPPFRVEPMFVQRVWGTRDLRPWYDKVAEGDPIGEVWLTGDACRVSGGALAGLSLGEVFVQHAEAMLGSAAAARMDGQSPLLLKVIFAQEKLSVQVHPDDRLAQKYGQPRGKTECWYALAAQPGAEVAAGLRAGVTLQDVEAGVKVGTLERSLDVLPVTEGEMIFVDAGTVHAIWPGSVLLETQQNCDLTYRLYDYGRPRELHVAKALEAIRLHTGAGKVTPLELADRTVLVDRDYFSVEKIPVDGTRASATMPGATETVPGLSYLFAAAGAGRIVPAAGDAFPALELPARAIVAIPAAAPEWNIEDLGGLELIRISPRRPSAAQEAAA